MLSDCVLQCRQGDSPGVPYVLEIWPAGHFSPIHDHGDSNAVIKVVLTYTGFRYYSISYCRSPSRSFTVSSTLIITTRSQLNLVLINSDLQRSSRKAISPGFRRTITRSINYITQTNQALPVSLPLRSNVTGTRTRTRCTTRASDT